MSLKWKSSDCESCPSPRVRFERFPLRNLKTIILLVFKNTRWNVRTSENGETKWSVKMWGFLLVFFRLRFRQLYLSPKGNSVLFSWSSYQQNFRKGTLGSFTSHLYYYFLFMFVHCQQLDLSNLSSLGCFEFSYSST